MEISISEIHLISSIFILVSGAVPIYLSFKLRNKLQKLTIILSLFIFVHGVYHITGALGMIFVAENLFDPISIALLLLFALYYLRITRKSEVIKKHG